MEKEVKREKEFSNKASEDIIQAESLMNSGKYHEALLILNKCEEKGELNTSDKLSCHLIQSSVLKYLGNYQKSYRFGEKAYQESKNMESHLHTIDALASMAYAQVWIGDFEKAEDLILEGENLLKSLKHASLKELEQREGSILYVKAVFSIFQGDIQQSLEYAKYSLEIREKYGNKHEIVESLNTIGWAYSFLKSDLDIALKYAERCQALSKEINHQQIIHFSYVNLGVIYALKGDFEKGLNYHKQALQFFEATNNMQWISGTIGNIADIYMHKGKFDLAVDYRKKSLKLAHKMGNAWFIANNIASLIEVFIFKGDNQSAKALLEELKQLNDQENNKWIEMEYLFARAIILKSSPRTQNRAEAEKILKKVIQREIIPNLDINVSAIVNLCELLLDELRITNDIGVLDDLNPYINKLLEIAKKTNSYWVLTEAYILQAKLALLTLDLKQSRRLLIKAQDIAEKHGMYRLAAKVSFEHDELLQKLKLWEQLKDTESSLSERLKLTNVAEQMKSMIQKRRNEIPKTIEENPIMILVISEGGIPTFSKLFAETFAVEDDLISSFLAAFNTFSDEIFSEGLDRASFGEFTLLMKPISTFLVCYLFKGQSYSAQRKIQHLVEKIEKNKDLLDEFKNYYQTNQIIRLEDNPILNSLITDIFIEKKFNNRKIR
jgi:tetratricopeptide (TPR) repeat protein